MGFGKYPLPELGFISVDATFVPRVIHRPRSACVKVHDINVYNILHIIICRSITPLKSCILHVLFRRRRRSHSLHSRHAKRISFVPTRIRRIDGDECLYLHLPRIFILYFHHIILLRLLLRLCKYV